MKIAVLRKGSATLNFLWAAAQAGRRDEVESVLKLSKRTENLLNAFFPESSKVEAKDLIETMCGDNLPFCENSRSEEIERIRFSAIRMSEGQLDKLFDTIELAQTDW